MSGLRDETATVGAESPVTDPPPGIIPNPFTTPDSIRDTFLMHGIGDEFLPEIDPVYALATKFLEVRNERDQFQKILESPDGIDIIVNDRKIDRADFPHYIVRTIAYGLAGAFPLGITEVEFTVTDPEAGPIRVRLSKAADLPQSEDRASDDSNRRSDP
jgi:hypothetical protein